MKLLFNLEAMEGNRIKASPGDYLKSLPAARIYTGDRHE